MSPILQRRQADIDETKQNIFTPILNIKLSVVDRPLHNHKFLMGDLLTLPDILFVILNWLAKLKIQMAEWQNLSRYFTDMQLSKK